MAVRYQQAADVVASRIKAVRVAAITNDWVKAQANELVPEEDMDAIMELDDMKRMAKEVERQAKIKLITQRSNWSQSNEQENAWGNRQKATKTRARARGPRETTRGKAARTAKPRRPAKAKRSGKVTCTTLGVVF